MNEHQNHGHELGTKQRLARKGFTLLELLVVVAVVSVLLGILLPALSKARLSAEHTASLASLRDIGQTVEAYLGFSKGLYPFKGPDSSKPYVILSQAEGGPLALSTPGENWSLRYLWFAALRPVASWPEHYRVWQGNTSSADPGEFEVAYEYAAGFFARPEVWTQGPPMTPEEAFKPVNAAEVSAPSRKVMFFESKRLRPVWDDSLGRRRAVLTADGAAFFQYDAQALPPFQNRVDQRPPLVYRDTASGVRGYDLR